MVSPGGEWCHIFYLVHFIFFNILSGVSPGCRTGVSIKSGPNSIFSAAVNVTASDLVEVRICQTFLWLIQFFNSWAAGGCRQGKSTSSKWTSSFEFVLSAAERCTEPISRPNVPTRDSAAEKMTTLNLRNREHHRHISFPPLPVVGNHFVALQSLIRSA